MWVEMCLLFFKAVWGLFADVQTAIKYLTLLSPHQTHLPLQLVGVPHLGDYQRKV